MSVDETRSSSSLQGNRVDHVEGSEEQGSADVQISKHSVFTSFVKGLENVVEECRSCGDIGNLLWFAALEDVISFGSSPVQCPSKDVSWGLGLHFQEWLQGGIFRIFENNN